MGGGFALSCILLFHSVLRSDAGVFYWAAGFLRSIRSEICIYFPFCSQSSGQWNDEIRDIYHNYLKFNKKSASGIRHSKEVVYVKTVGKVHEIVFCFQVQILRFCHTIR